MMGRTSNWLECSFVVLVLALLLCWDSSVLAKKKGDEVIKKCETCLKLVEKFDEGLERTSRYNYAGGDVDWEEKKLGSYSTSETRFIEITEQLCSSSAHDCHRMLENNEDKMEEWWKEHQETDLEQWLCIDKIKVCCPENTFGPECEDCLGGVERPCRDNGKCSGGGTRGGTGKCKCNGGYKGALCDVCKHGFYEELNNDTHTICRACDESCSSTCTGVGPKACRKCKGGYYLNEEEGCKDINECDREASDREYPCDDEKQYCDNNKGSYKCMECDAACNRCLRAGNTMCMSCKDGYELQEGKCIDIDECEDKEKCTEDKMRCINLPGRFYCDCIDGYERMGGECVEEKLVEAMRENKFELPDPELDVKDSDEETDSNDESDTVNDESDDLEEDSDTNIPNDTAKDTQPDSETTADAEVAGNTNGSQQNNDNLDGKNIERTKADSNSQNQGVRQEL